MIKIQIVIDTNIFISSLKNDRGASFYLLSLLGKSDFETNISVPLIMEYESVANRFLSSINLTPVDLNHILDFICFASNRHEINYLWRPFLKDPKDDLVLELAVKAKSRYIITFNKKDFVGCHQFGIKAVTPYEYLTERNLLWVPWA